MNRRLPSPLRMTLFAVLATATWVALSLILGATSASAADADSLNDSSPDTSLLGGVVQPLVSDVVAVVPQATAVVTDAAASHPAGELLDPVAELADSVVSDVPIVGNAVADIVGDAPVQSVITPVTGVVDDGLGTVADVVSDTSGTTGDVVDSILPPAETVTGEPDPKPEDSTPATTPTLPTSATPSPGSVNPGTPGPLGVATTTDPPSDTAASVFAGSAPIGDPLQSPAPGNTPLAVIPAQSGSSASQGGATGNMVVAVASWASLPPASAGSLLAASADDVVPASPSFDLGCTPD